MTEQAKNSPFNKILKAGSNIARRTIDFAENALVAFGELQMTSEENAAEFAKKALDTATSKPNHVALAVDCISGQIVTSDAPKADQKHNPLSIIHITDEMREDYKNNPEQTQETLALIIREKSLSENQRNMCSSRPGGCTMMPIQPIYAKKLEAKDLENLAHVR